MNVRLVVLLAAVAAVSGCDRNKDPEVQSGAATPSTPAPAVAAPANPTPAPASTAPSTAPSTAQQSAEVPQDPAPTANPPPAAQAIAECSNLPTDQRSDCEMRVRQGFDRDPAQAGQPPAQPVPESRDEIPDVDPVDGEDGDER